MLDEPSGSFDGLHSVERRIAVFVRYIYITSWKRLIGCSWRQQEGPTFRDKVFEELVMAV